MKFVDKILLLALVAVAAVACGDDEVYEYGDFSYNIVTYAGESGDNSVFTFQSYNDSPLITLVAGNLSNPEMNVGQRLLLNYIVDEGDGTQFQKVTIKGLAKVNTDTLRVVTAEALDTLKMDEIKLKSVWRTGDYLNIRCQLQYTEKPRRMFLATTGEVGAGGMVECYQIQDLLGATPYYWLETYFSYYIEPAWGNSDCTAIRYNLNDLTYPDVKYYDFVKE